MLDGRCHASASSVQVHTQILSRLCNCNCDRSAPSPASQATTPLIGLRCPGSRVADHEQCKGPYQMTPCTTYGPYDMAHMYLCFAVLMLKRHRTCHNAWSVAMTCHASASGAGSGSGMPCISGKLSTASLHNIHRQSSNTPALSRQAPSRSTSSNTSMHEAHHAAARSSTIHWRG